MPWYYPEGMKPYEGAGARLEIALLACLIAMLLVFAGSGIGARIMGLLLGPEMIKPADRRPADADERRDRPRLVPPPLPHIPRSAS